MKKVYLLLTLFIAVGLTDVQAQLLQWNTFGNTGTELTEPSVFNNANLSGVTNLTLGAGLTAAANANRFGGFGWFDTGNTPAGNTLAEAIAGNNYIEFIVTPNAGFSFTPTTLVFTWDRSGTGPSSVTLRSSADAFASDLGTVIGMVSGGVATTTPRTITITTLTNITIATTFRLYGYAATGTAGTGGFDNASNVVDVQLNGSTAAIAGTSITTGAVTTPPFCVDATNPASGNVAFTSSGTFPGNTFTAYLSDAAGLFGSPVPIGSTSGITGTDPSGSIAITIPAGTVTSAGYKIRIDEATIPITGSESASFIVVNGTTNVSGVGSSFTPTTVTLNWTNPLSCFDEVMIVAKPFTTIAAVPTGDGSAYNYDLNFLGTGSSFDVTGKVVYKGVLSPETVTNLTTGIPYFFRIFSRKGTNWSPGVEISVTPSVASSPTDYFRSVASGSWGSVTTWESSPDSSTWSAASLIPGATAAHVVIQGPDSVTLDAIRTTINLTLMSGAKMNAQAFTIAVTGRFNLLGTASFYQGGANTPVPGVGLEQVISPTSNYHFNGTQAGTTGGVLPAFGNLFWEPTASGAGTFQNSATVAPATLGLYVRGDMTINIQGATPREIRFATGASITRRHVIDGNLNIISSSSVVVVTNGGLPVYASITVGGNLNISAGILQGTSTGTGNDGSASLNLSGNINNTGGTIQTGLSINGQFSLNYVGTGAQAINNTGGTFTFTANQLDSVNKSAGALTLNTPITHAGTIRFISGIVNTTSVNLLTMAAGSAVSNAGASFVNGPVKKIGNTAFTFPVGKTVVGYVPIGLSNFVGGAATDQFTAEYIKASASALGGITDPFIQHVSPCNYWTLNLNNGTPTVDITAYWNSNNTTACGPYVDNLNDLALAHFDGTNWNSSSVGFSPPPNGIPAAGDITWPGVTAFSPFSLASISANNPLPITINYFNGSKQNGNHLLNWKVNNSNNTTVSMEIQRSSDGRSYTGIYNTTATALQCQQPFSYTDNQAAKGVNYYRLKMSEVNGKISYSNIVPLINADNGFEVMNIAPNPVLNRNFNLNISAAQKANVEIVITDMQGRLMQKRSVNMIAGFNSIPVNVSGFGAGTYQVYGVIAEGRSKVIRFVIQ